MAEFTDQFANLTSWTLINAGSLVVTGNKAFYGTGTPGAGRAFEPGAGNFRLVGSIVVTNVTGTSGQYAIMGVSNKASPSESTGWTTIGIDAKGRCALFVGATETLLTTGLSTGTYLVTIVGDAHGVSFAVVKSDRSIELRAHKTRAEVGTIKLAIIYNADERKSPNGNAIAPIGGITSLATLATRENIEGIGTSRAYNTTDAGGKNIRLEFPAAYDSGVKPKGWILFAHGAIESELENSPIDIGARAPMFKAFLEAGYCVGSSSFSGESTYGNEQTGKDFKELYDYVHANYLEAPIVVAGFSAGAAAAYLAIKQNLFHASALLTISGLANVNFLKEHRTEEPYKGFVPSFCAAYGVAPEATFANYTEKIITPELDPNLWAFTSFRNLPVVLLASPEDTLVLKTENADKIKTKLEGHQFFLKELATTGGHASEGNFPAASTVTLVGEALAAKLIVNSLAATLELKGGLPRLVKHGLAAKLTSSGTVRRTVAHSLTAALSFAGTLPRKVTKTLAAQLTTVGVLPRNLSRALAANVSFSGRLPRNASHSFKAKLTLSATRFFTTSILDSFHRANEGSIAASGKWTQSSGPIRIVSEKAVGQESGAYSEERWKVAFGQPQEAYFTFASAASTKYGVSVRGALAGETETYYRATWSSGTKKVLIRHQGPSDTKNLAEATVPFVVGDVMGFASIGANLYVYRVHAGTFEIVLEVEDSNSGIYGAEGFIGLILEGATAEAENFGGGVFVASVPRTTLHGLAAHIEGKVALGLTISRQFVAALSFAGIVGRSVRHPFAATLTFAGKLSRSATHALVASLSLTGSLRRSIVHRLTGALTAAGALSPTVTKPFEATVSFAGALPRALRHGFQARLESVGFHDWTFVKEFTAKLSFEGKLLRNHRHAFTASLRPVGTLRRTITQRFTAALNLVARLRKGRVEPAESVVTVIVSDPPLITVIVTPEEPEIAVTSDNPPISVIYRA